MVETKIWVFLGLMAVVAVAIPFVVRKMKKRNDAQVVRAFQSLDAAGHVVEDAINQRGRPLVRVWGTLEHPVALDLRILRRGRWLGKLGASGSGGMLDPEFEQAYRVTSSEPERARMILDPDIQRHLIRFRKLEFRLGSVETLLPPDYWRGQDPGTERRLRRLWMIQVPGKQGQHGAVSEVVETGSKIARNVAKNCLPPNTPDLAAFMTAKSEAPWL